MMRPAILLVGLSLAAAPAIVIAGNVDAGKEKSAVCAACHGADGNSAAPDFPRLAGQQADYLAKALRDYKTGARKNAIMAPQAANLSAQDIADLAAYFSAQRGLFVKKAGRIE
ncbi:MAG TPA: cytochrome c [Burkholderiales bacterium]|nr:cytochrome c [Burkholderiales bacterium]